jgi:tight adherence protein B
VTGTLVGLLLGTGLASIWWSCWPRVPRRTASPGWYLRLEDVLVQAGAPSVSPWSLLAVAAGSALTVLLAVTAVSRAPAVAACFALVAGWAPVALVRHRAARRRSDLRELWPDVIDNLTSAVRAGLSLPEALAQVAERGPEPLRRPFARFARDYRATGRFSDSLAALKETLADPVADRLVEALRITREVGGSDLGRLLRTLSAFLREDLRTRGEIEARQSWTVAAARLAVAAPWLVLGLLATRPGALAAYNRPEGVAVLAVGAVLSVVAYRLMLRLGRLPDEDRVLR